MIKERFRYVQNINTTMKYIVQFQMLNMISTIAGHPLRDPKKVKTFLPSILKDLNQTLKNDAKDSIKYNYAPQTIRDITLLNHIKNFTNVIYDYKNIISAREINDIKLKEDDFPEYYQRKFHFQTDGYLSEHSAKLYDHQVEILFTGTANIMRRSIIKKINQFCQRPKYALEMAAGVGSSTRIIANHFPDLNILASDLSPQYIEYLSKNLFSDKINTKVIDATNTNLESQSFDLVYNVFLFHELPHKERINVIKEMKRLLKPGGTGIIIDSIQIKDKPEYEEILFDFPKRYHEPFYTHYIKNPLEDYIQDLDLKILDTEIVFFSKVVTFTVP